MTKWIKHEGGPSPVASDVWVLAEYRMPKPSGLLPRVATAASIDWEGLGVRRYRVLNQRLIDAARLEGIRLGLEAVAKEARDFATICAEGGLPHSALILAQHGDDVLALDPKTIAREAVLDQLTSEAQEQNMGYDND